MFNYEEVDKLHIKFCKAVLGVTKHTVYQAVLSEHDRVPHTVIASLRSLKYWIKVNTCNINSVKDAYSS